MMKKKEQLLNIAVKDLVNIGQLLQVDAKEEQLLSVVVDDYQLLKDVNLEDNQDKEGWLIFNAKEENDEDCVELLGEVPKEMIALWHEVNLLEQRLEKQKVGIQVAKYDRQLLKDANTEYK